MNLKEYTVENFFREILRLMRFAPYQIEEAVVDLDLLIKARAFDLLASQWDNAVEKEIGAVIEGKNAEEQKHVLAEELKKRFPPKEIEGAMKKAAGIVSDEYFSAILKNANDVQFQEIKKFAASINK